MNYANLVMKPDINMNGIITQDPKIKKWNCDPLFMNKQEPWYMKTPQPIMISPIDKSKRSNPRTHKRENSLNE